MGHSSAQEAEEGPHLLGRFSFPGYLETVQHDLKHASTEHQEVIAASVNMWDDIYCATLQFV